LRPPNALAVARRLGVKCRAENLAFLSCKAEDENPAKCLAQGAAVQNCVSELLVRLSEACPEQFTAYSKCMEDHPVELYSFDDCRWHEKKLAQCAVKALDIERAAKAIKVEVFEPPKIFPPVQNGPPPSIKASSTTEK